jgi:predicted nucleotidyltransferase
MPIPRGITGGKPYLGEWAILAGYRGSIAHGMYTPSKDPLSIDDKDAMFVAVPSLSHYFGLSEFGSHGTYEVKRDEWDIVCYEAKKFISLLEHGNPNVLMMLWLPQKSYLKIEAAGQLILSHRRLFVGRHVYHAFTGYAYGQLHRMTHYVFEGYMGQKRKELVDRFGYDTKNAAHLIRLLRMGIEFLRDGELYVEREDATQLLEIKRGEWTLEQVKAEAETLFKSSEAAYLASTLPARPDREAIGALCVDVVRTALKERGEL